jgi:hypothetical protein
MFKRRRRAAEGSSDPSSAGIPKSDVLLAETIARHFEGGTVAGSVARIGLGGVEVQCAVNDVLELGAYRSASLFFRLQGGPLGPDPIFTSISGYEKSPEAAIVVGGCNWACAFGPVLRAGLTGVSEPEADEFEVVLDGRRFRGVVQGVDRVMMLGEGSPEGLTAQARDRLGGDPWLAPRIVASPTLPLLTASTPTVLSLFISQGSHGQTTEVKVNGADWGPACSETAGDEVSGPDAIVMLRELAVLTAVEPAPPLQRAAVQRTLDGLATRVDPWQAAGWQGWQAHRGKLGDVLADVEVSVIEVQTGPLPADYRHFLTQVAGPGAGPGYGLCLPRMIDNSILLAHAGCGAAWVLRLDQAEYGTVWAHAIGSDGTFAKVADSFTEWFANWLDAAVRDLGPWVQWDVSQCATAGVLSQVLTAEGKDDPRRPGKPRSLAGSFKPGALALFAGEGYLPAGSALDPCHGCVDLAARFDLPPNVFAPGVLLAPPA